MEARRALIGLLAGVVAMAAAASTVPPAGDLGAWGNLEAHPEINRLALELFQTRKASDPYLQRTSLEGELAWGIAWDRGDGTDLFNQDVAAKKQKSVQQWIVDGGFSADEPEGPMSLRHFYDPTDKATPWLTDTQWIFNIVLARASSAIRNPEISLVDWASDTEKARIDDYFLAQDYSWKDAKDNFRRALSETESGNEFYGKAWRAVGETMHLMSDLAIPAHVRNDGHAAELGDGDLLETSTPGDAVTANYSTNWAPLNYEQDIPKLMHEVASWTNSSFLSKDTVPVSGQKTTANGRNAFPSPSWQGRDVDKGGYVWHTVSGTPTRMARQSAFYRWGLTKTPAYVIDGLVVNNQRSLVIPTAVRASAAVLERFLPRFEVTVKATPEQGSADKYSVRGELVHRPGIEWPDAKLVVRNGAYVVVDGKKTPVKLSAAADLNEFSMTVMASPGAKVMVQYDLGGYLISSEVISLDARTPTPTASATTAPSTRRTGEWVLKLTTPDVGKVETPFSFPGLACNGGTKATSTETSATTTATGTCQVNGALVANEKAQHSWSRPPDRLTPGQELTVTLTVSSSGLCSWQGLTTEDGCRRGVQLRHSVWLGNGWPGGQKEFRYSNLIYDSGNVGETPNALDRPTSSVKWKVPTGSGNDTTLLLQFGSSNSGGWAKVYTNFWYEWRP